MTRRELPVICCFIDAALDEDYHSIMYEKEIELINSVFQTSKPFPLIQVVILEKADLAEVNTALTDYGSNIQIFHYVGTEATFQYLINDLDLPRRVPNLRLFFYNYCQSKEEAESLLDKGVRIVIACPNKVSDEYSISFAGQFYHHLMAQRSIGEAFKLAQANVREEKNRQSNSIYR